MEEKKEREGEGEGEGEGEAFEGEVMKIEDIESVSFENKRVKIKGKSGILSYILQKKNNIISRNISILK